MRDLIFILKNLIDYHYFWLNPLLIAFITLSSVLNYRLILITSSISLAIISIFDLQDRKTKKTREEQLQNEKKKNEVISDNIKNLFDGYLYQLSNTLGFGNKKEYTERITLYIHDGINKFIPFGRFSQNPEFRKHGRPEYPDDQGCIAKSWQNGWCFDNDFSTEEDQLFTKHKDEYKIPKETSRKFKMKSRLYAAGRINTQDSGNPLAILLVESTEKDRYDEDEIKKKIEDQKQLPFGADWKFKRLYSYSKNCA